MASQVYFGGKTRKLPGTYATVVSGIQTQTVISNYSNVLVIDAGAGTGYNAVKGISGHGKERIYAFEYNDAVSAIRGGSLRPFIEGAFKPALNQPGVATMYFIKAAASTPANTTFTLFSGAITATSFQTNDEGLACNTMLDEDDFLKRGYQIKTEYDEATKQARLLVYLGTYQGQNADGYEYDKTSANSGYTVVFASRRYSTPAEMAAGLNNSGEFKSIFTFSEITAAANATFENEDGDVITDTLAFAGGSDTYLTNLSEITSNIKNLDFSFCIVLGVDGSQALASDLFSFVENEADDIKQMITFDGDFDAAIDLAKTYNNDGAIVVTGKIKKASRTSSTGFIVHEPLVTAGYVMGRICGLSPEISVTLKQINIDGMDVDPSDSKQEDFLDFGVISPHYDYDLGYYCLTQGVNSLQRNEVLINDDCTTFSIQVKRIIAQTMKNLQQRSKIEFFGGNAPLNRGSLSNAYVKAWTEGILQELTVDISKTENNYLINYEVTKVETIDDNVFVYFTFTVNGEVSKVFFTGVVLG